MTLVPLAHWLANRERKAPVTTVVLHATAGGSAESSIEWLRRINLSYHYVIERNGFITKCVPAGRVAYHAGKSLGPDGPNVNEYSVGIAFANRNDGEAITKAQLLAAAWLLYELRKQFPDLRWVTTHYAVSPGRKTDPKGFPPKDFGGLEFWKR